MNPKSIREIAEVAGAELTEMADDYIEMVGVQHGPAVKEIMKYLIASHAYNNALATLCAVTGIEKELAMVFGVLTSKFAGTTLSMLMTAHGLENATDDDIKTWNELAQRFVQNSDLAVQRIVDANKN